MLPADDGKGNLCLGGLIGLVEGGVAGMIIMQGQNGAITNPQSILISAFLAGLALKGVSDSVNHFPTDNEKTQAAHQAAVDAEQAAQDAKKVADAKKAAKDAQKALGKSL
jgi:cytochrome c biogenesis protein ResB